MNKWIIIGFRGAGKTTLGSQVAKMWEVPFVDLDIEFESQFGGISEFVEKHGITEFRIKEHDILCQVLTSDKRELVVATGGGVVDWDPSMQLLQSSHGPKVFLHWPPEVIWERLKDLPDRRNILKLNTFTDMLQLYNARLPKYNKIATFTLDSRAIKDALDSLGKYRKNG